MGGGVLPYVSYIGMCRPITYLACVAGAWKQWPQEKTRAREGDTRVSLVRARSLFRPLLPSPCYAGYAYRVGFLGLFGLKTGIHFAYFGLESGMVFEGTTGVYERIYRFTPNE